MLTGSVHGVADEVLPEKERERDQLVQRERKKSKRERENLQCGCNTRECRKTRKQDARFFGVIVIRFCA